MADNNNTNFRINDLVEYHNPRTGKFECWVTGVNIRENGNEYVNLKAIEHGYNIMNVPLEYVTLIRRSED